MAGPWEAYAQTPGPWAAYADTAAPASPEPPQQGTDWLGLAGRAAMQGVDDVKGMFQDAADKLLPSLPGARAAGNVVAKAVTHRDALAGNAQTGADQMRLPTPQTGGQRVFSRGVEYGVGALAGTPEASGASAAARALAMLKTAATGGAAGLTKQGTAEAGAPEAVQDLAALVVGAAPTGAKMAGHPLAKALAPYVAAVSKEAAAKQAGAAIASRATNLDAVTAALDQPHEIVPGSEPTTYQQTGDQGLGQLERQVRTPNEAPFQERAAAQNTARRAAMDNVETGGDPNDLAKALKQQFDDLNAQHDETVQAATDDAQGKAHAALGPEEHPDAIGTELRGAISEAHDTLRAHKNALYDAADPDGTMTVNATATQAAPDKIMAAQADTARPLTGEAADVFDVARNLPSITPLRNLTALADRTTSAMAEAKRAGDLQTHRLLVQLRSEIEDNLSHSISQEVASQHPHVVEGRLTGSDALVNRLHSWLQQHESGTTPAVAQRGGDGRGIQARPGLGGSPADDAGALGANRPAAERPGSPAGNPSVSPADLEAAQADLERWRAPNPASLFSAIKKAGGLRTRDATGARIAGPDVEAALTDVRQPGLINNQGGHSPERVAQGLADAGWFGPDPGDPSAAFEAALTREARGAKVFHPEDTFNAEAHKRLDADMQAAGVRASGGSPLGKAHQLATYRAAIREMRAIAEASGITGADRMTPQELLVDLQEREAIRAEGSANETPNEDAAEFDRLSGGGPLKPTVDDEAKARLDLAKDTAKRLKQTFYNGPVADILNDNGFKNNFTLPNGQVAGKFFRPGPAGFEGMQALLKTGAKDALPTITRFAAHKLREAAFKNGVLDPAKFEQWRSSKGYGDALRALPADVRAKFADAATAAETLADAQAARSAAMKEAQAGVLGKVMGASEPEDVVRKVAQALNSVADMKTLAKATASDPAARLGLRRAIAEHVASKFVGNTEVAGSGLTGIKSDGYQTFIRQHRAALHLVFSPEEVRSMEAVAEDLQRAARSNTTKAPASPGTAQDTALQKAGKAAGHSWMQVVGGMVGMTHGGPEMAVLGAGFAHGLSSLNRSVRAAGITRVDQLVTEAMLHPAVARELLKKAPRQTAHMNVAAMPLNAALWAASQPRKDAKP